MFEGALPHGLHTENPGRTIFGYDCDVMASDNGRDGGRRASKQRGHSRYIMIYLPKLGLKTSNPFDMPFDYSRISSAVDLAQALVSFPAFRNHSEPFQQLNPSEFRAGP
jgi:hypothetical protein